MPIFIYRVRQWSGPRLYLVFSHRKVNIQIQTNQTIQIMIVNDFNLGNDTIQVSFEKTIAFTCLAQKFGRISLAIQTFSISCRYQYFKNTYLRTILYRSSLHR